MAAKGWEPVSANRRLRGVSRDQLADIRRKRLRLNLAVKKLWIQEDDYMSTTIRKAWLGLPVALLMIAGCGGKPAEQAKEAAEQATEAADVAMDSASQAVDAAGDAADAAMDASGAAAADAAGAAADAASDAADAAGAAADAAGDAADAAADAAKP